MKQFTYEKKKEIKNVKKKKKTKKKKKRRKKKKKMFFINFKRIVRRYIHVCITNSCFRIF